MQARIRAIRLEAEGIASYRLEPLPGHHFPAFTAGAHIEVALERGLTRSYSLVNDPADFDVYELGVQLDPSSRGGSRFIHERWHVGQVIEISEPRNHFPLNERAAHTILIGGGIGITPLLSMAARLQALGRSWELHYAVRTRNCLPFAERLTAMAPVHLTVDDEPKTPRLDLQRLLDGVPDGAHVYCCGPERMLDAYRVHGQRLGDRLHFEYFAASTEVAIEGGYSVRLHRSGQEIPVKAGETMLDALLNAGVNVPFACSEGICGTCRVGVLDGLPDHRDNFLSAEEKSCNGSILVCCSGSRSPVLTLDL